MASKDCKSVIFFGGADILIFIRVEGFNTPPFRVRLLIEMKELKTV
jgi:hypothetical protein